MKRTYMYLALLGMVGLAACGDDDQGGPFDSALADGRVVDAAAADGAPVIDGATADSAMTDAAMIDAGAAAGIVINEIYVTTQGGDGRRYVELRAPAGTALGGLQLRLLRANGTVAYTVDVSNAGAVVPADGLWVVGGALVSNVDQFYSNANWGLDSTQGAVQLVRSGVAGPILLDVVGYGPALTPAPPTPPTATVEGATAVAVPAQNTDSIGRRAGGVDTDVNSADLCRMTTTPGVTNSACL